MKRRKPRSRIAKEKKMLQLKSSKRQTGPRKVAKTEKLQAVNPTEVLIELIGLLEDFSPVWYSGEQRRRAMAALRVLGLDIEC